MQTLDEAQTFYETVIPREWQYWVAVRHCWEPIGMTFMEVGMVIRADDLRGEFTVVGAPKKNDRNRWEVEVDRCPLTQ